MTRFRALVIIVIVSLLAVGLGVTTHPVYAAISDSLVAYWKLDEGSGPRNDSLSTNHLTDNNTVTQQTGRLNYAAQFTAANSEYLNIADNAALSSGNVDLTITSWVYLDSKPTYGFIASKWGNSGTGEYDLYYSGAAVDRFIAGWSTNGTASASDSANSFGPASIGVWTFVVMWHDATANTLNIQVNNGVVDFVAASGGHDGPTDFQLGAYLGGNNWNGRIDEVGIWKRVLTANERTALWNNGEGCTYPFIACAITNTPTATATSTASNTPTYTATATATSTASNTPTNTATATATSTASNTPTDTATATATSTASNTPTDTATATATPTASNTPTDTATATATPTASNTPTNTATATATSTRDIELLLSSGNQLTVQRQISFGDIAIGGAVIVLVLLALVAVIYSVVNRWL